MEGGLQHRQWAPTPSAPPSQRQPAAGELHPKSSSRPLTDRPRQQPKHNACLTQGPLSDCQAAEQVPGRQQSCSLLSAGGGRRLSQEGRSTRWSAPRSRPLGVGIARCCCWLKRIISMVQHSIGAAPRLPGTGRPCRTVSTGNQRGRPAQS